MNNVMHTQYESINLCRTNDKRRIIIDDQLDRDINTPGCAARHGVRFLGVVTMVWVCGITIRSFAHLQQHDQTHAQSQSRESVRAERLQSLRAREGPP